MFRLGGCLRLSSPKRGPNLPATPSRNSSLFHSPHSLGANRPRPPHGKGPGIPPRERGRKPERLRRGTKSNRLRQARCPPPAQMRGRILSVILSAASRRFATGVSAEDASRPRPACTATKSGPGRLEGAEKSRAPRNGQQGACLGVDVRRRTYFRETALNS